MPPVSRPIDKRHAIIHTASIDVKIMRLDKKQVTLSVFRQLKERKIFELEFYQVGDSWNPKVTLLGTPWGIVNYVWDKCESWTRYHLVWQDGNEIYWMSLPLVKELTNRFIYGKQQVWGCRSCDVMTWCRQKNDNDGRQRCSICNRKCGYFFVDDHITNGEAFFVWLGEWEIWGSPCDESDKEALEIYKRHMETFEALDQLFIAV
jgi:hypothetical protein